MLLAGKKTTNEGGTIDNQTTNEGGTIDKQYQKVLDGFLMIVADAGDMMFISENVSKCLGLSQVRYKGMVFPKSSKQEGGILESVTYASEKCAFFADLEIILAECMENIMIWYLNIWFSRISRKKVKGGKISTTPEK